MEEERHFELTKNGKVFILFGSLFVIIGLAIDTLLLIVPGVLFLVVITSTFISFIFSHTYSFNTKMSCSKDFMRSRGLLAVAVELTNPSRRTILTKISLRFSFHFKSIDKPETILIKLLPQKKTKIVWLLLASRRGNGEIGPIEISVGSFQYLFKHKRILKDTQQIKILPQRPRINIPWKTKKELLLKMVHEFAQRVKGRGDEFFALRDYLPGDQLKHIDWYATARHDKLISREFEDQRNLHFLIYLDLSSTMFGPKFEYALSSVVELCSLIKGTNHDLAVVAYSENVQKYIIPQVGKHELRLMLNLYDLEATGVHSSFLNAVKFTKNNNVLHSIAIIFSDLEGDLTKKLQGIHLLQTMGSRVIFVNFATMHFNILSSQDWMLDRTEDMNYGEILQDVFPSIVSDEYRKREIELRQLLYSIRGDYVDVFGYDDNIILSLFRLMKKYSPTQRLVQEAVRRTS